MEGSGGQGREEWKGVGAEDRTGQDMEGRNGRVGGGGWVQRNARGCGVGGGGGGRLERNGRRPLKSLLDTGWSGHGAQRLCDVGQQLLHRLALVGQALGLKLLI